MDSGYALKGPIIQITDLIDFDNFQQLNYL